MKIAMFGQKRLPSRSGGVEVAAEALSTRMAALGHPVTCYDRGWRTRKEYRGVRIRSAWALPGKGLSALTASCSAAVLSARSDAQVVHIHAEGPSLWCWIPKLAGKRVVVTIHGLDWQRQKWQGSPAVWLLQTGEKLAARFADQIIVLTESDQRYFETRYRRKTALIPNGIDPPVICPPEEMCRWFGLEKDSYFLFLGRLVPEKGVHTLIEAFRQVNTPKRLVIAGAASDTDAYAESLYRMAREDDRVLFTGFVQGKLLQELYSNAYGYVLPSFLEGMPLTLLEALSYGNCCVASNIPACRETLSDAGIFFAPGDSGALAEILQSLCDDPTLVRQYKLRARERVAALPTWDTVVERTLELYR